MHPRMTQQGVKGSRSIVKNSSKSFISLKHVLIKNFLKGYCSLLLNSWMTRLLCLRCLGVSPLARESFLVRYSWLIHSRQDPGHLLFVDDARDKQWPIAVGQVGIFFLIWERYHGEAAYRILGTYSSWYSFGSNKGGWKISSPTRFVKHHICLESWEFLYIHQDIIFWAKNILQLPAVLWLYL